MLRHLDHQRKLRQALYRHPPARIFYPVAQIGKTTALGDLLLRRLAVIAYHDGIAVFVFPNILIT